MKKKYLWILGVIGIVAIIAVPIGIALPKAEAARDNPRDHLPQLSRVGRRTLLAAAARSMPSAGLPNVPLA